MARRARPKSLSQLSECGLATQSRVTLAFRRLRSLGYAVMQRVEAQRGRRRRRHVSPYARLVKDLRLLTTDGDALPLTEARIANVHKWRDHGIVWWAAEDADELTYAQAVDLRIYFARGVDDQDRETGQGLAEIAQALRDALVEQGLDLFPGQANPHLYSTTRQYPSARAAHTHSIGYLVVRASDAVFEVAEAAKKLGGDAARRAVIHPTRKQTTEENADE